MSVVVANGRADQDARLRRKTQDQHLRTLAVSGAGLSLWEADVLVGIVDDVYFAEPGKAAIRSGQIRYECVDAEEGAGKPLAECALCSVVLTLIKHDEEAPIRALEGAASLRRIRIQRLTEEAREQGGLLTQEDLGVLLSCDVRTIRRDIKWLRDKHGIVVATRGQQKDIGPGVSHKGVAVRHWIQGKEPVEVARQIHHSLTAVERYIQHFSRVIYLLQKGFRPLQIALTVGISIASVNSYLAIYDEFKNTLAFTRRLGEIDLIGDSHHDAVDEKKGPVSPQGNSSDGRGKPWASN